MQAVLRLGEQLGGEFVIPSDADTTRAPCRQNWADEMRGSVVVLPTTLIRPLLRALGGEALTPPPWWLYVAARCYLSECRAIDANVGKFIELCFDPGVSRGIS